MLPRVGWVTLYPKELMIDSIFKNSMPPAVSDLRAVGVLPRDGPRLLHERRPRLLQPRRVGQPHGRRQVRQAQRLCRPSQRHFEVGSPSGVDHHTGFFLWYGHIHIYGSFMAIHMAIPHLYIARCW